MPGMHPERSLYVSLALFASLLLPANFMAQTSSLTVEQLQTKISALEPVACNGDKDAGSERLRDVLLEYKQQLAAAWQKNLDEPTRKEAIAKLSKADQDALAAIWKSHMDTLSVTCPPAALLATAAVPAAVAAESTEKAAVTTLAGKIEGASDPYSASIRKFETRNAGGALGDLTISPMQVLFGPQDVGTASTAQTVTLTNSSSATDGDFYFVGVDVIGKNFQLAENGCGTRLVKGANCTVKLSYAPFDTEAANQISSLRIRYVTAGNKAAAASDPSKIIDLSAMLRGSPIHWKFPFTRMVAGVDLSAVSSKPTKSDYFIEFNLTAPTDRFFIRSNKIDPLESRTWVFLNPRLTSVPSSISATANLNPSLDSFNSLVSNGVKAVGQGVDVNFGFELAILKPRSGIAWWSDFPNSHARLAISGVVGMGVTTPFSSDRTEQDAVLNRSILDAYPALKTQIAQLDSTNCTNPLASACPFKDVAFVTPERSRFFRKYYAGLRFKSFFFNEDVAAECWADDDEKRAWQERHPYSTCGAPYNIFPGIFDFTLGQDESVTAGSLHGIVWRLDAVYPLHFLPSLHVFGSVYGAFHKNVNSTPFKLTQPTDTLTDANSVRFSVPIPDRDYYRIGLGIDLVQLFKRKDPGQPDTTITPKDTAKTTQESKKPTQESKLAPSPAQNKTLDKKP